jgi:hypothetical protein
VDVIRYRKKGASYGLESLERFMTAHRAPSLAAGLFFCGYLLFQIVYPMLPWFFPGFGTFTWHMYAARDEEVRFSVVFADGSHREVGNPLKIGSPIRVLGPSFDQSRYLPRWLCVTWEGAEHVVLRDPIAGREVIRPCPQFER